MSVGSYALSLQEREQLKRGNPNTVGAVILKLVGDQKAMSLDDLRSITGLPADMLVRTLGNLQSDGLIRGTEAEYLLTERGDKARFFVAS